MTEQYNYNLDEARSTKHEARSTKHEARSTLEVYVATHKDKIDFAIPDYCTKIQVNAERSGQWPGYLHDNDNPDNISLKNPNYSELTALYSMWKNCKADIQGLYHYRRFISGKYEPPDSGSMQYTIFNSEVLNTVITREEILEALEDSDIILPRPIIPASIKIPLRERAYSVGFEKDYENMCAVIHECWPDYVPGLEHVLNSTHFSSCNMFIARREFVNDYCTWLFDVLAKIEARTNLESYDTNHARIFGYLSETLLNIYVYNNNLKYKYFCRAFVVDKNIISITKRVIKKIPFAIELVYFIRRMRSKKTIN